MEKLKTKAEYAEALDKLSIDYPKFLSGESQGKPNATIDTLHAIYEQALKPKKQVVTFHRPLKTFNSMTFRMS